MAGGTKHISIKDWAEEDKPREKLISKGATALTNAELLAILINTGTKNLSALDIAKEILNQAGQDLLGFAQMDLEQLKKVKGLGPKKSVTLLAALELGRRGKLAQAMERKKVTNSRESYELLAPYYTDFSQEHCVVMFLSQASKVLAVEIVSTGGLTATVVDPRVIFRKALSIKNVTSIILSHNHPSGNVQPSEADKRITNKLSDGAKLLDLKLLDHIIIGHNNFYSFADAALLV